MAASQRNSDAVLRLLRERKAEPNHATIIGRTPLMAAAGTGSVALIDAAMSGSAGAIRLWLENGAKVNACTKRNGSAFGAVERQRGSEFAGRSRLLTFNVCRLFRSNASRRRKTAAGERRTHRLHRVKAKPQLRWPANAEITKWRGA
jgi:hypothetical protein